MRKPTWVDPDPGDTRNLTINGLRYQLRHWPGNPAQRVVILHGWMDNSASFALLARALGAEFDVHAPDWRGFGSSSVPADGYWYPDYFRDLDALIDELFDDQPATLIGHSMGGNIAGLYAGIRPERVGRLVTVEGFGMVPVAGDGAPHRYRAWMDGLRQPPRFRSYPDFDNYAERLKRLHPRMEHAKALWLARCWGRQRADGTVEVATDPLHKIPNPVLYRLEEAKACWREITAPVLWIHGDDSDYLRALEEGDAEPGLAARRACFRNITAVEIPGAGHMLHHDVPELLAGHIRAFLAEQQ